MRIDLETRTFGWRYLRIEVWTYQDGRFKETFYGLRVLWWRVLFGYVR